MIDSHIENDIAKRFLSGEFVDGDTVLVDVADGKLTFVKNAARQPAAAVAS